MFPEPPHPAREKANAFPFRPLLVRQVPLLGRVLYFLPRYPFPVPAPTWLVFPVLFNWLPVPFKAFV